MDDRRAVAVLAISLSVGFALRAYGAFEDGLYWPDEIYQSFEPAHQLVFGYGLIPWEFIEGARNWSLPGLVALLLKLGVLMGMDTPPAYIRLVKLFFALWSTLAAAGVYRLSRAFGAQAFGAAVAASLWALAAPAIYFAPRAMAENACAAPLVWGLALLFEARPQERKKLIGGASLLGLAVLFRLQCAAVAVVALGVFALLHKEPQNRVAVVLPVFLTLSAWALFYGALDALTWHRLPDARFGGWFHSVIVYLHFNVAEGRASGWGTSPWTYYFKYILASMPTVAAVLALGTLGACVRRSWPLVVFIATFLAVHLWVPHKEYRFVLPVLPLACAAVGCTVSRLRTLLGDYAAVLALVLALWSTVQINSLTLRQLGANYGRPQASAWDHYANVNRLLLAAGRQDDLCGLRVDVAPLSWAGGSTYLHRRVPLYPRDVPAASGHFNYVMGTDANPSGLERIAEDGGIALYRMPNSTCVQDADYQWRLF